MMYISQNPKNRDSMAVLANIIRKTSNGEIASLQTMISCIFPEYGTSALDIPYYDSEKRMYLVDQYTAELSRHTKISRPALPSAIISANCRTCP